MQPALHAEDILPSQPPDDAPSVTAGHGGVRKIRSIRELRDMWWQEAEAYGVMPLDDGSIADIIILRQPNGLMSGRDLTLCPGQGHEPLSGMIAAGERSMGLVAHLSAPWQGGSGRPVASGNSSGGDTPCIQNHRLCFAHVPMGDRVTVVVPPPKGAESVAMTPQVSAKSAAKLRLFADRGAFAQGNIPSAARHLPFRGLDAGRDAGLSEAPACAALSACPAAPSTARDGAAPGRKPRGQGSSRPACGRRLHQRHLRELRSQNSRQALGEARLAQPGQAGLAGAYDHRLHGAKLPWFLKARATWVSQLTRKPVLRDG